MFSKHDLHEAMNIKLGDHPVGVTPQRMRVGLARSCYYSTIIRNVSMIAEREGWSGEDKFVALAFYLQLRNEVLEDMASTLANIKTDTPWLIKRGGPDHEEFKRHTFPAARTYTGEKAAEDIFPPKGAHA